MVTTLSVAESAPNSYPAIPNLATGIDKSLVWARIEGFISWRWNSRAVTFIVEGCGEWAPPLNPYTNSTTKIWSGDDWADVTAAASPLGGYCLEAFGPYKFSGTVGSTDDPPAAVLEAARRLGDYFSQIDAGFAPALTSKVTLDGLGDFELGSPNAAARALQYSGAGDLLRAYRNLGAQ